MHAWTRSVDDFDSYPRLEDLLQRITGAADLHWRWHYLWATAIAPHGDLVLPLEKRINESPGGLDMAYEDVMSVCEVFDQVVDCVLIGSDGERPGEAIAKIEIFDSTTVTLQWEGIPEPQVPEPQVPESQLTDRSE